MNLKGIVKQKKFHDEESDFYILTVNLSTDKRDMIIVKGNGADIKLGDYVEFNGAYENTKNGKQFVTPLIKTTRPSKVEIIEQYLSSGLIKPITKRIAEQMVSKFGADIFRVLEEEPEQLKFLKGVGEKTLQNILTAWDENEDSQEMIDEIITIGFNHIEAIKIYKRFKLRSISTIKTNIFFIRRRVKTIEFEKLDEIFLSMNKKRDDNERVRACIEAMTDRLHESGSTIVKMGNLIAISRDYLKVDEQLVIDNLNDLIEEDRLFLIEDEYVQSRLINNTHLEILSRLYDIRNNGNECDTIRDLKIIHRKDEKKIQLSVSQRSAIINSVSNKISIITGKPGCGKTTVLNEVIKQLRELDRNVLLCAPTGKAAQKMKESTGFPAATIHRLLEFNPHLGGFMKNDKENLECDTIIIDESSMIDIFLLKSLLNAINKDTQIIFIGDVNQLPSVGAGSVLRDLIECNRFDVSELNEIFRQSADSKIINVAHNINEGNFDFNVKYSKDIKTDFYFIATNDDQETIDKLNKSIDRLSNDYNIKNDVQILTSIHNDSVGTKNVNQVMQEKLNTNQFTLSNERFKMGDKVMQTVNNYDKSIYNGDSGEVVLINEFGMIIDFGNGFNVEYKPNEIAELSLSYCVTVHKAQGSEYPIVFILIPEDFNRVLDRSLLYTAITRAKAMCVIIGNKSVFEKGIQSTESRNRKSNLSDLIMNYSISEDEKEWHNDVEEMFT
jgi:exodeoxyribonuclease V alpha subunit